MRGVVTHHPAQYLRIETYNYTIKQYWVCCLRKKRAGPGCKNGPHPDPYGLGVGTLDQMCGFITPKKRKLRSADGAVDKLDADNNRKNNDNNNNNSIYDNNSKNDNDDNDDDNDDSRIKTNYDINSNKSYKHKNANDLRLIDAEEEKEKSIKFNIIESETTSSDSSINIKSDEIPYNSITSYFFRSLYCTTTDTEKNIVTYDMKNNLKYNSDFMKTDKMKKKETLSFPVLENTEINEIRSKKKVGFDYDCERKKEYFM